MILYNNPINRVKGCKVGWVLPCLTVTQQILHSLVSLPRTDLYQPPPPAPICTDHHHRNRSELTTTTT
ncbi:hypothetical protein Hanom_Chr14g01272671 [Helianthus anomalus]